jgi:hypothetical protein
MGRVDAERQRGRTVGDEVDPQDLCRHERQGDACRAGLKAERASE